MKINLSKAYDQVSWLYFRLLLLHVGFELSMVKWIMCWISTISIVVLLNESISSYFQARCGLHQGCPLSPYLFLFIADGLSRAIKSTKRSNYVQVVRLGYTESRTHILFVGELPIFCYYVEHEAQTFRVILYPFYDSTGMIINLCKSIVYFLEVEDDFKQFFLGIFTFTYCDLQVGLKYLGFSLKPKNYKLTDWKWLLTHRK